MTTTKTRFLAHTSFFQEEEEAEKDYDVRTEPYIQLCIPYLPRWLAAICLVMNVFMPGTGM